MRRYLRFISLAVIAGCATAPGGPPVAPFLTDFENEVVREINLARANPQKYSRFVAEWRRYFDGAVRRLPGRNPVRTEEGLPAVDEAVAYLSKAKPVPRLTPSRGMSLGARDHVADTGPFGYVGHTGSDSSQVGDRVNRYGKWDLAVGENISYGGNDAREIVIRLIIDDGVPDRGHRHNIFDPKYRVVGVSFGIHQHYKTMCVTTFAAAYKETSTAGAHP